MATTDTVANYLSMIRNALMAEHNVVEVPASNLRKAITKVLHDKGFIRAFKEVETPDNQGALKIALKYDSVTGDPVIRNIQRASKPGRRYYVGADELPRVLNGLGIAVISTSHGVVSDKEARDKQIGGEVLCYVY